MKTAAVKQRAPRNRTLSIPESRLAELCASLRAPSRGMTVKDVENTVFNASVPECLDFFPAAFVDLMILDPPYNLSKDFDGFRFEAGTQEQYIAYLESFMPALTRLLKPDASVYICGDWRSSSALQTVLERHLVLRNRIVWEREKGRGAKANWKNCSEDIWFATAGKRYFFDPDAVKLKRKVVAPYREAGKPKDWNEEGNGRFRLTAPSNFWDDISVPYWSMPENTDHPTQKPEKLLAKLILASSKEGDMVFDPFLGSGTTAVTAKKLSRRFCGVELNRTYCAWALERLERAEKDKRIQGFSDGVFWERNSLAFQKKEYGK